MPPSAPIPRSSPASREAISRRSFPGCAPIFTARARCCRRPSSSRRRPDDRSTPPSTAATSRGVTSPHDDASNAARECSNRLQSAEPYPRCCCTAIGGNLKERRGAGNSDREALMPNTVRMAATPLDRRAILKSHALFGQLTESEIDQLLAQARVARYRAGEVIFLKSSPGTGMMAVLKGEVRISAPAPDGREIVLNTMREGEIFGEIALLDGKERSADAVAQCACELLVIERRSFVPFLRNNPEVALRLISVLCERLRRTTEQVEDMLFRDLPSRLAKKLLELAEEGGERINKQLRQWQIEGLVAVEEGRILLRDETALRAIADPPA